MKCQTPLKQHKILSAATQWDGGTACAKACPNTCGLLPLIRHYLCLQLLKCLVWQCISTCSLRSVHFLSATCLWRWEDGMMQNCHTEYS